YSVFSGLGTFTDAATFDTYLSTQNDSSASHIAEFQTDFDCPGYDGTSLQYHLASLCGMYVDISTRDDSCNSAGDAVNTCKSSATFFLNSAVAAFDNASICTQGPGSTALTNRNSFVAQVTNFISATTDSTGCIVAAAGSLEYNNCGFHTTAAALNFCSSTAVSCCSLVAGFTGTVTGTTTASGAAASSTATSAGTGTAAAATTSSNTILGLQMPLFIGIVAGGGGVLLAIILTIIVCACRARRKRREREERGEKLLGDAGYAGGSGGGDGRRRRSSGMDVFRNSPGAVPGGPPNMTMSSEASARALEALRNPDMAEMMEVVFNYVPNLSDEVYLYAGDRILVKCKFDDGWGYGVNMTTRMEGTFPLAC
ncbi:hypothetical protein HK405_013043, partial [Cladochytrium tenue]